MKRPEMLKSEVALAYKSLCHELQPITTLLFGDELPQRTRNISQVKRMAARSINYDRRRCGGSVYINFEKPRIESSRGRQFANYGRSNLLNFKRRYEYCKPPYQQRNQSPPRQSQRSSSTTTKQL